MEISQILYEIYCTEKLSEEDRNSKLFSILYPQFLNKKTGSYFTAPEIAKKVTDLCLTKEVLSSKELKILDPACGVGEFLIAAANHIYNEKFAITSSLSAQNMIELRQTIISDSLFGYDVDEKIVQTCKLRLLLWSLDPILKNNQLTYNEVQDRLISFKTNIIHGDFFNLANSKDIFSAVLCNPPYNAEMEVKVRNSLETKYPCMIRNSAAYFYLLSREMVKSGGRLGFIMPKSLVYSKRWRILKNYLLPNLSYIQDLSKAFKYVKLEEIILISTKDEKISSYKTQIEKQSEVIIRKTEKLIQNSIILNLRPIEYALYQKLSQMPDTLEAHVFSHRGLNIQSKAVPWNLKYKEPIWCIEGKQIKKFHILPSKKIISKSEFRKDLKKFKSGMILGQLANAHVKNPKPHFKLAFSFAPFNLNYINFDTVININGKSRENSNEFFSGYLLCYLNSKLFAWYLYKIVYGGAIRSTRLDYEYLKQVPFIPQANINEKIIQVFDFIANAMTFLSYVDSLPSKSFPEVNALLFRLNEILDATICMVYLLKPDLLGLFKENSVDWEEIKNISGELKRYFHTYLELQSNGIPFYEKNVILEHIKSIHRIYISIWNSGINLAHKHMKKLEEWKIIEIPN